MSWPHLALIASPILALAAAIVGVSAPSLAGAGCTSIGNNPMKLDNIEVCNRLGDVRTVFGWGGLSVVVLLVPVAGGGLLVGLGRALRRRRS